MKKNKIRFSIIKFYTYTIKFSKKFSFLRNGKCQRVFSLNQVRGTVGTGIHSISVTPWEPNTSCIEVICFTYNLHSTFNGAHWYNCVMYYSVHSTVLAYWKISSSALYALCFLYRFLFVQRVIHVLYSQHASWYMYFLVLLIYLLNKHPWPNVT